MCGIAGNFNFKTLKPASSHQIETMLKIAVHRGPDDAGIHLDNELAFGMNRLAIIGLSSGHQPMHSTSHRYAVICNGEIYNYIDLKRQLAQRGYQFQNSSDTEVICAIFEIDKELIKSIRGMFAFACFDRIERKLYLYRDRMGKKPLFWAETPDGIVFASEIKQILASGCLNPQINMNAVKTFLNLGYIPGSGTAFKNIMQLEPGHYMTAEISQSSSESSKIKTSAFWRIKAQKPAPLSLDTAASSIRGKLLECVNLRMVADVPIGLFLSRGVDSNAILHTMIRNVSKNSLQTFTIGFDEPSHDESGTVAKLAQKYGYQNERITLGPSHIIDCFSDTVWHTDNLMANPANYAYRYLAMTAARSLKVVLHGGGGDELFFGYPTYVADHIHRLWQPLRFPPSSAFAAMGRILPSREQRVGLAYKLQRFSEGLALDSLQAHAHWRSIFTGTEINLLCPSQDGSAFSPYADYTAAYQDYDSSDPFEKFSYADLMVWWRHMGLYQADAIGMASSLEVRVPMMDHEFIELVYQIPRHLKFSGWRTKALFRKAIGDLIPPEIARLPKEGFHIPLAKWYRGPLKEFMLDNLSPSVLKNTLPYLNASKVNETVDEHLRGMQDNSFKINALLVLAQWHKHFLEGRFQLS